MPDTFSSSHIMQVFYTRISFPFLCYPLRFRGSYNIQSILYKNSNDIRGGEKCQGPERWYPGDLIREI
jgi:hypothetical protein